MKSFHSALFTLLLSSGIGNVAAQTPNRPFPQHPTYAAGVIIPNHISRDMLDRQTKSFYWEWKKKYVKQGCGDARYYVSTSDDHGEKTTTVSEAHGYGMIIVALMAGEDAEARTVFDGMYRYFRDHPAAEHPYLMSWKQNDKCQNIEGNNSATDGDMDIAYALLLADKQWGSVGGIDYRGEAVKVIHAIMQKDIHPSDLHIMLGSWVLEGGSQVSLRGANLRLHDAPPEGVSVGDRRCSLGWRGRQNLQPYRVAPKQSQSADGSPARFRHRHQLEAKACPRQLY